YWDKSTLEIQKDAFRTQVAWAKELNLPIDIHCREAFDELFPLLEELKDEKLFGILHCFTGTLEQAQRGIDLGFALGIGGVVTYKKAGLDAVVREIDLHHLVLETDAPYLAPTPYRGKENESSYLYHVAEKVADQHKISVEELAKITTENSKRIFNIEYQSCKIYLSYIQAEPSEWFRITQQGVLFLSTLNLLPAICQT